jgi:hypothetical protein
MRWLTVYIWIERRSGRREVMRGRRGLEVSLARRWCCGSTKRMEGGENVEGTDEFRD